MLSPAARSSAIFLRTVPFPLCCGTFLRTTQLPLSNFRPLSTSHQPLPSLEDILKRKAAPKPDNASINTADPSPPPNGPKAGNHLSSNLVRLEADTRHAAPHVRKAGSQLFLGQLPPGDAVELEGKIREAFGEVPIIRVGARLDGKKYAHLEYESPEAALKVLLTTRETPVSISGKTISVRLAGQAPELTHHTLFFTGFRGTHESLKRALWVNGYRDPNVMFFLRSQARWGREGRIDFPTRVNIKDAYRKLNGLKIDERTMLNLSRDPPGSPPPDQREPRPPTMTVLLVGNLPLHISEMELEERVWDFFEPYGAITSVELDVGEEGSPQRFCYVRFAYATDALRASESLAKNPLVLEDLMATAMLIPQPGLYNTLFFRNYKGSRPGLERAFAEYLDSGRIKMLQLLRDKRTGKRNGSGIIEFTSKADATEALMEINGHDVEGWKLKLRFYKPLGPQGQITAPLKEPEVLKEQEAPKEHEMPKEQEVPFREPEIESSRPQGSSIKDFEIWRPLDG